MQSNLYIVLQIQKWRQNLNYQFWHNFNKFSEEVLEHKNVSELLMPVWNWLFIKILQFLSYYHETWSKGPPHGLIILTNFHDDSSKIVNFLLIVNFLSFPVFLDQSLETFLLAIHWYLYVYKTLYEFDNIFFHFQSCSSCI